MTDDECCAEDESFRGDWTWPGFAARLMVLGSNVFEAGSEFLAGVAEDLMGLANHQMDAKQNFREASQQLEQIITREQ